VIRDVALSLAARAVTISVGVITSIVTARALGVIGRGEYFYVITLVNLVVQFGHLGLASSNTYTLAKDYALLSRLAANSIWVSLVAGIVCSTAVLLLVAGSNEKKWIDSHIWILLLLMGPAMLYGLLASNLLIGLSKIRQYNFFQIANSLCQLAALGLAAWMSWGVVGFLAVTAAISVAAAVALMWFLSRLHSISWRFDRKIFQSQVGYAGRAYLVTLLGYGVSRASVFLLDNYAGKAELGIYSVAVQFADALVILPATVAMVLFPGLLKDTSGQRFSRTMRTVAQVGLLMAGLCVVTGFAAIWIVPALFGQAFSPAVQVLWWMLPGVFALSLTSIVSQYLAAMGAPPANVAVWLGGFVFLLGASSQLIPRWGASGAAAGMSLTYVFITILLIMLASKHSLLEPGAST
jgi:antigen flippase